MGYDESRYAVLLEADTRPRPAMFQSKEPPMAGFAQDPGLGLDELDLRLSRILRELDR